MEALTQATFQQLLLDEKRTGLVLFVKEGCPICQELHPLIEEIEQGYTDKPCLKKQNKTNKQTNKTKQNKKNPK